jgi:hypothetical protein
MQTACCDVQASLANMSDVISLGDESMRFHELLVLSAVAGALSIEPGRADSCSQDIDRGWAQVNAKIQARSAAGRSVPQGTAVSPRRSPATPRAGPRVRY